jgi:putative PIN family toxin of toxin-antitoxin system
VVYGVQIIRVACGTTPRTRLPSPCAQGRGPSGGRLGGEGSLRRPRCLSGAFELIVSEHVLQELARTLADPYFVARLPREDAVAILTLLNTNATVTELTARVRGVATHPEDDAVLATALSGQATILCTRDKQLLRLRSYQHMAILSPGELLARFEAEA